MSGVRQLLTAYGLDALIVVAAASAAVGTAQRDDPSHLAGARGWLEVVAIAALVLLLALRRWFPLTAPSHVRVSPPRPHDLYDAEVTQSPLSPAGRPR